MENLPATPAPQPKPPVKPLEAEMHAMLSQALERCESLKLEAADAQRSWDWLKDGSPKKV